jgi:hypothetical protein
MTGLEIASSLKNRIYIHALVLSMATLAKQEESIYKVDVKDMTKFYSPAFAYSLLFILFLIIYT